MRPRSYASVVWRRVLLLADDPRARDSLSSSIREMGFEVRATGLLENALRLLERETYDILLIDLSFSDGSENLIERVRRDWPDLQTIVISAQVELAKARQSPPLEGLDHLARPCALGELERALDRARRRRMQRVPTAAAPMLDEPPEDVSPRSLTAADTRASLSLEELERKHILATLEKNGGNRTQTAAELGISLRKLYYRLGQYQREGLMQR
jgi:DNA-binding NtrC family response regulator